MGVPQLDAAGPPTDSSPLWQQYAWRDFSCRSLADSYREMGEYARSLRRDVLIECNPAGVGPCIMSTPNHQRLPVDHGRLLQGGEAFWAEGLATGCRDGKLYTRIRTYKVARSMHNVAFTYTDTPLEMAESMAFNSDCLGCIGFFEGGRITATTGATLSPLLAPYIRFFHQRRDLFRGTEAVADAAVLRSFPSQAFGGSKCSSLTARVEDMLIGNRAVLPNHLRSPIEQPGPLPGPRAGRLRGDGGPRGRSDTTLRSLGRPVVRDRAAGHARPMDAASRETRPRRPSGDGPRSGG